MIAYNKSSPLGKAMSQVRRKKPAKGELLCDKIVPRQYLVVGHGYFRCPYCSAMWDRGGCKEGFVKVAARRHVHGCHEIALFNAGYVIGDYTDAGHIAEPFNPKDEYHARFARSVKATIKRRSPSTKARL